MHFNIGNAIFGIILIYLIVTIFTYLTSKHISVYEVREGSILRDTAYTGLIIRDETVVASEADGFINYFSPEGSKVGARTDVYTLSNQKLSFRETGSKEQEALSADEQAALLLKIQSFSENSDDAQFRDVYTLKDNINNVLESKSSQSRQAQLEEMLTQNQNNGVNVYKAASDGIVMYSLDGFETVKVSDVSENMLSKENYKIETMANNVSVKPGTPIYKLITSDTWTLVISLSEDAAKEMADMKRVKVKFSKDNQIERADLEIVHSRNSRLGLLTFHSSMIRYAKERYLDVELILKDESGLKIPKSSVINKKFYTVPKDYLTQNGNSREMGVLVDTGTDTAEFKKIDVYYWNQENDTVYLDPQVFEEGAALVRPESSETYSLRSTKELKGVYNINKGYAVFKQIEILCESDEYYIVKAGNNYSLTNYDHIALDGETVTENSVVF
jgi:hypothetical protein